MEHNIKQQNRVCIYTLGCKANQADSDQLATELKRKGLEVVKFKEEADLYIINTCTVTAKAGYQSRQAVRRAFKKNPNAKVYVVGCDAVVEKEVLEEIEGVIFVGKLCDLDKIIESIEERPSVLAGERSRPFVKIQDGCENFCTYCIVPFVRGKIKSEPAEKIIKRINELAEAGYFEIVITGIHIGHYGKDYGNIDLTQLIQQILDQTTIPRIRLSSIEPDEFSDDLIQLIADNPDRIAGHLHIPLQSGSDTVLKRMKRRYSTSDYRDLITKIKELMPDISIGADVITGFPGETDKEFEETYGFLEALPITYLHVFTYSDREGTKASEMAPKISEDIKKTRTERLRKLSEIKRKQYFEENLGREVTVVFDAKKVNGFWKGVSENYITTLVEEKSDSNNHYRVKLNKIVNEGVKGEII